MSTNYFYMGNDLSTIFEEYITGSKASNTNIHVGINDISNLFEPYTSGSKASNTNIYVDNNDISNIFSKKLPTIRYQFTINGAVNVYIFLYNDMLYVLNAISSMTILSYDRTTTIMPSTTGSTFSRFDPYTNTNLEAVNPSQTGDIINSICTHPDGVSLYYGGKFTSVITWPSAVSISNTKNIVKYNTQTSQSTPLVTGSISIVNKIARYSNILYVCNQTVGNIGSIYNIDNDTWSPVPGTSTNATGVSSGYSQSLAINHSNGTVYFSGTYGYIKNGATITRCNNLIKYDPSTGLTSAVSNSNNIANGNVGIASYSRDMIIINNILYIGSNAYISGGNIYFNTYNTETGAWSTITSNINSTIYTFKYFSNKLFIGGIFTTATKTSSGVNSSSTVQKHVVWDLSNYWYSFTLNRPLTAAEYITGFEPIRTSTNKIYYFSTSVGMCTGL